MIKKIMQTFSTIDILVNNAGICFVKTFENISENEWDKIMKINLKGPFSCSQAVFPIMKERKKGAIVNITDNGFRIHQSESGRDVK